MGVKDFHELRVYELAFECAVRIYEMTERFPTQERYISPDIHRELSDHYNHFCSQLAIMMSEPERWSLVKPNPPTPL